MGTVLELTLVTDDPEAGRAQLDAAFAEAAQLESLLTRFDPESEEMVLIAEGMPSVASMVFGEGDFDPHSIYATSTFRGGGKIWRVPVGVGGAKQYR